MKNLTLNEKLSKIQVEFKANKSKFNSFGKYNFRSAEDILEALKPYNEKYGVSFTINESLICENPPVLKSTASIIDNNGINVIKAIAIVGVDLQQKGMQVPQQYGSASSYGKKYALGNLLLIDDTQDADATNTHGKEKDVLQELKERMMEPEQKWLNVNTPEFTKAIEYLKSGGTIEVIEKKYKLAAKTKQELLKVK
jgi:hypothetical protein